MNKEKLNILMKKCDKEKKPKHWRKFINDKSKSHNIILKYGKSAFCTHCQKYFYKDVTIHPYEKTKCPYCNKEYYVRNHNIRKFEFTDDIALYCKADNTIVVKIFEIKSSYDYKSRKFKQSVQEYARFIPGEKLVINNSLSFARWNIKIYHNVKNLKWHFYTGKREVNSMEVYPYNSKIFNGTSYEYIPIDEFKKEYKDYNEFDMLKLVRNESFEFLWKMGLHSLSLSAKYFKKSSSFFKSFGVPKTFLKFMVKHDLNYQEYKVLTLFHKTDAILKKYNVIKKLQNNYNELVTISEYVSLDKFLNYSQGIKNINIYADYLKMLKDLNYNKRSKSVLFPEQLIKAHDEIMKRIKVMNDINTNFAVYLRYLELSKYTYQDEKYIVFPAPSVDAIKDEGKQQNNCVARMYLTPYKDKETEIYFIRKLDKITQSLITLEYRNNYIVQKELQNHKKDFSEEQNSFIKKWLEFRQFIDLKEKFKTRATKKSTEKLVA